MVKPCYNLMKKLLILLPALIGCAFLNGCVDEVSVSGPGPAYYGDPYYVYGDVQYYNDGGRYYYIRDNRRFYTTSLPTGGRYWHGNGSQRGVSNRNNVVVSHQNVVQTQHSQQHFQKTTTPAGHNPNIKGKKYKKGDPNQH